MDGAYPRRVVDDELSVGDDGVVQGVPVAADLGGHLRDGPAETADLDRRPATGSVGQHLAGSCDPLVPLRPALHRTALHRARPARLPPHEPSLAPEAGKIEQLDRLAVFHHGNRPAPDAAGPLTSLFDVHDDRTALPILDGEESHVRQADKQLAHAPRVGHHRGSPVIVGVGTARF